MEIGYCQREERKKNEDIRETALREVFEESGVKAEIKRYIGMVHYTYKI